MKALRLLMKSASLSKTPFTILVVFVNRYNCLIDTRRRRYVSRLC